MTLLAEIIKAILQVLVPFLWGRLSETKKIHIADADPAVRAAISGRLQSAVGSDSAEYRSVAGRGR
jgi:hypothetical protein